MLSEELENKMEEYFERYVPAEGKADTVGGEVLRAINRIGYRFYNDGDRIFVGYGNNTCNAPYRYLMRRASGKTLSAAKKLDYARTDEEYEKCIDALCLAFLDDAAAGRVRFDMENEEDMWDYKKDEDEDYEEYEDEEEDYGDEDYD